MAAHAPDTVLSIGRLLHGISCSFQEWGETAAFAVIFSMRRMVCMS